MRLLMIQRASFLSLPILAGLISGLWVLVSGAPSAAAQIEKIPQNQMGCVLRLSGPIEAGDAATLDALLVEKGYNFDGTPIGHRICLDSPGGSFVEAVRMADLLAFNRVGTVVDAGAICESACAIMFMAGSFFHNEGERAVSDRHLHPTARLGFHAPALLVEERLYSQAEITGAYDVALSTIAEVRRLISTHRLDFPESLFIAMLDTPFDAMRYVETVADAALWRIGVVEVRPPVSVSQQGIWHACHSAESSLIDRHPLDRIADGIRNEPRLSLQRSGPSSALAQSQGGYMAEASVDCVLKVVSPPSINLGIGYIEFARAIAGEIEVYGLDTYLFYDPATKLSDLPLADPGVAAAMRRFLSSFR